MVYSSTWGPKCSKWPLLWPLERIHYTGDEIQCIKTNLQDSNGHNALDIFKIIPLLPPCAFFQIFSICQFPVLVTMMLPSSLPLTRCVAPCVKATALMVPSWFINTVCSFRVFKSITTTLSSVPPDARNRPATDTHRTEAVCECVAKVCFSFLS